MSKSNLNKKIKVKNKFYPSAVLLQSVCQDDYKRLIDTYDKIYEKVNIALAFCGIILLVILSNFDYTQILMIINARSKLELFTLLVSFTFSLISIVSIVMSVIQLLLLMKSRPVVVVDFVEIRNSEIYNETNEIAAMWLIDKYTTAISKLRHIVQEKQKQYNSTVYKIIISLLSLAITLIIQKGF